MKVLFHHYHPIIQDLGLSFNKHLKFDVTVAMNLSIKDHYGDHNEIFSNNKRKYLSINWINLQQANILVKQKRFDIVFVDGVYDGDKQLIELCKQNHVPYVCISGYPYTRDEDSKNILSFSWFMPQVQYLNQFPSEGHVKQFALDVQRKNILVWYPELSHAKKHAKENPRLLSAAYKNGYASFIHRFEECNKVQFNHFELVRSRSGETIENYTNLSQQDMLFTMNQAKGFAHFKMYDAPGIAMLEAMILGCTPFVYQQFILGSYNQDVLIDNHSAVVSDSDDEFVENLKSDKWAKLSESTQQHAMMITDFMRQQNKLEKFIEKALKNV
jgi:hypothetical protein